MVFWWNSALSIVSSNPGFSFPYYYQSHRKLELIYSDPAHRLVGDIALLNCETAVVSDRRGSISVLSCTRLEGRHKAVGVNVDATLFFQWSIGNLELCSLASSYSIYVTFPLLGIIYFFLLYCLSTFVCRLFTVCKMWVAFFMRECFLVYSSFLKLSCSFRKPTEELGCKLFILYGWNSYEHSKGKYFVVS